MSISPGRLVVEWRNLSGSDATLVSDPAEGPGRMNGCATVIGQN
jgi:hypothetical protein